MFYTVQYHSGSLGRPESTIDVTLTNRMSRLQHISRVNRSISYYYLERILWCWAQEILVRSVLINVDDRFGSDCDIIDADYRHHNWWSWHSTSFDRYTTGVGDLRA